MSTFGNFFLHQEYAAIAARGDPLTDTESLIDWEQFCPRLSTLYQSDTGQGGRPHTDVIVLMKILVLHCSSGMVSPTTSSNGRLVTGSRFATSSGILRRSLNVGGESRGTGGPNLKRFRSEWGGLRVQSYPLKFPKLAKR